MEMDDSLVIVGVLLNFMRNFVELVAQGALKVMDQFRIWLFKDIADFNAINEVVFLGLLLFNDLFDGRLFSSTIEAISFWRKHFDSGLVWGSFWGILFGFRRNFFSFNFGKLFKFGLILFVWTDLGLFGWKFSLLLIFVYLLVMIDLLLEFSWEVFDELVFVFGFVRLVFLVLLQFFETGLIFSRVVRLW